MRVVWWKVGSGQREAPGLELAGGFVARHLQVELARLHLGCERMPRLVIEGQVWT